MSDASAKNNESKATKAVDPAADLTDELRPEYDLDKLNIRGVGTYFKEAVANYGYIHIDDEIRRAFPDERSVNEALRALLRLSPEIRAIIDKSNGPDQAAPEELSKAG